MGAQRWLRSRDGGRWLICCLVHSYFLNGFCNRIVIALDGLWNYATFQRGTRLITGPTS